MRVRKPVYTSYGRSEAGEAGKAHNRVSHTTSCNFSESFASPTDACAVCLELADVSFDTFAIDSMSLLISFEVADICSVADAILLNHGIKIVNASDN